MKQKSACALAALTTLATALIMSAPATAQMTKPSAEDIAAAIGDVAPSKGAALVLPIAALQAPEVRETVREIVVNPETGIAMEGFDPVGFFTEGKAMRGAAEITTVYRGARFQFATAENRDRFLKNPERYLPAFGGYCTYTIAEGALTPASPLHWTIHGDRLFFTRSAAANEAFRRERKEVIEAGDRFWAEASDAFQLGANAAAHVQ
ncbi:MAG: YHS domain-containing (seleno)protein [Pseudomonadota bacterium]